MNKTAVKKNALGEVVDTIVVGSFIPDGYVVTTTPSEIRSKRDALLSETDWWAVSDRKMTEGEVTYRQALRDITDQSGFPNDVTWPAKP